MTMFTFFFFSHFFLALFVGNLKGKQKHLKKDNTIHEKKTAVSGNGGLSFSLNRRCVQLKNEEKEKRLACINEERRA